MRNTTRTLVALLGFVAATGCSSSPPRPVPVPVPIRVDTPPTLSPSPDVTRPREAAAPLPLPLPVPAFTRDPVGQLAGLPDPVGPAPALALRYLQALQRGDWLGAARLLAHPERARLSTTDMAFVERVGRDVLHNAGGRRLGPCTASRYLNRDAAVLRCGTVTVVVHVEHLEPSPGVKIDRIFSHDDRHVGPHTHADTALLS